MNGADGARLPGGRWAVRRGDTGDERAAGGKRPDHRLLWRRPCLQPRLGCEHADGARATTTAPKPPTPRVVHVALGLPLSYVCVVPNLLGFTQAQAVKLLARGHCALGSVRRPRHHLIRNRKVIVYFQQYAAGSWYSIGRRVSVDIH